MFYRFIAAIISALAVQDAYAKECWALTDFKGQSAFSSPDKYVFQSDRISRPMVLCFNDDETGSVSGDDAHFVRLGLSTLVGLAANAGLELVEAYQIDRGNGKVLFTKSRIGTSTVLPGGTDFIGAFVGKAIKLSD